MGTRCDKGVLVKFNLKFVYERGGGEAEAVVGGCSRNLSKMGDSDRGLKTESKI